ncbi:MAG: DUF192 domain-containing protein [Candidatus Woesearchaeota archaeon]
MIKDITNNKIIARNCNICRNFFTRGIGLMFRKKITPTVLAFRKPITAPIHTCFMCKSIDVLFIDSRQRVADLVKGLKPWKLYTPKTKAMLVIELPEGAIAKSGVSVGDVISFKKTWK